MKKSLYFLTLMLVFALILCACTKDNTTADETTVQSTTAETEAVSENITETDTEATSSDNTSAQETTVETETETEIITTAETTAETTTAEETTTVEVTTTEETTTEAKTTAEVTTEPETTELEVTEPETTEPETTEPETTEPETTEPETTEPETTEPETTEPETTEPETTEPETTEPETTKPETEPLVLDFNNASDKILQGHFVDANQTVVSVHTDDDGEKYVKLTTSGTDVSDPHVTFNLQAFAKKIKSDIPNASVYKYIMLKVRSCGMTSGSFNIYYTTLAGPTITQAQYIEGQYNVSLDGWQYVFFNCADMDLWEGRLVKMRLDYISSAMSEGESIDICEIKFVTDDKEYYNSIGADFDNIGVDISAENANKAEELLSSVEIPSNSADSYKGETAEYEDASLNVWFDHMYDRTAQSNNTSTGKLSYEMMLAKNEKESCQMILASNNDVSGLKVYVSDFTNANGDTLKTELFWGYYFNIGDERLVDPIVPVTYERSEFFDYWMDGNNSPQKIIVNKQQYDGFDIAAGQNQTFVISVTSTADTPAGEYSATVRVLDKDGREVKKATVYTYVWNFTLSDATSCKTLMDIGSFGIYGVYGDYAGILTDESGRNLYQIYYDYLLENRICGYTIPGMDDLKGSGIYSDTVIQYMNNPRVVAFQTLGWKQNLNATNLTNAYEYLSQYPELMEKAYFYPIDEPMTIDALNTVNYYGSLLSQYFPGYKMIIPMHVNYPVVSGDHFSYVKDSVTVWCPQTYFYTTFAEWYANRDYVYWGCPAVEANLGAFKDRMNAEKAEGDEVWWYVTGMPLDPEITFEINMEAVNYRTLFWQQKLYNVDGFLYYAVNDWGRNTGFWVPSSDEDFLEGLDPKHEINGDSWDIYGCGILIYAGIYFGQYEPIGSVRLECVRDGIEDFEYLTMLEEIYGYDVVQAIVATWTQNLGEFNSDAEAFTALRTQVAMLLETAVNQ